MDNSHLDKVVTLETKIELKSEQDEIAKLQAFEDDRTQNNLVFQLVSDYFKTVAYSNKVTAWKSKR